MCLKYYYNLGKIKHFNEDDLHILALSPSTQSSSSTITLEWTPGHVQSDKLTWYRIDVPLCHLKE